MLPRSLARALPLALLLLAACGGDETGPAAEPPSVHLNVAPRFQTGAGGGAAVTRVKVVALQVFRPDGIVYEPLDSVEVRVSPTALEWRIAVDFPPPRDTIEVAAQVELISESGGTRTVEWSGISEPVRVVGTRAGSVSGVQLGRGPLSNLGVSFLQVFLARTPLVEGDSTFATASVSQGDGAPAVVFYRSLDTAVATVTPDAKVKTRRDGTARIVAAAGLLADTATLTVLQRATTIVVAPDSITIGIRQPGTFTATVRDPRGLPISPQFPGGQVTWEIANGQVAINNGNGTFTGQSAGRTTVTARSAQDQTVVGTAVLRVQ